MLSRIDEKVKGMLVEANSESVTAERQKEISVKVVAVAVGLLLFTMILLVLGWLLLFG
jgi:hypothetical protein